MANKIKIAGTTSNTFQIGLKGVTFSSNTASSPYELLLPANAGSNSQVLISDGTGNLTWSDSSISAGTVTTNAQPNITSVGVLSSLSVSGTGDISELVSANGIINNQLLIGGVSGGNITGANLVSANYFSGNSLSLTGNIDVTNQISMGNGTGGSIVGANSISANYFSGIGLSITGSANIGTNIIYNRTYGSFTSNVTQTNLGPNVENFMTFNTTDFSNQVSIVSNSQITIANVGLYNIQFSAQVEKTDGGSDIMEIYLKKDGNPVPNTNTIVVLPSNNAKGVAAWNWLVNSTTANTYYEIAWKSLDANVVIVAVPSANTISNVAIPSVILTVTPVGA